MFPNNKLLVSRSTGDDGSLASLLRCIMPVIYASFSNGQRAKVLRPSLYTLWMSLLNGNRISDGHRQLVEEFKTPGLERSRHDEILDIIFAHIS